jgi:hypothetical protein
MNCIVKSIQVNICQIISYAKWFETRRCFITTASEYAIMKVQENQVGLKLNGTQLKYLGTTVTNENLIQEEIKRRLNLDNACYRSVCCLKAKCSESMLLRHPLAMAISSGFQQTYHKITVYAQASVFKPTSLF